MIFDFGCRDVLVFSDYIVSTLPGALAALAVVAGLGMIGGLFSRSRAFCAENIFAGWGVAAGVMTLASILFDRPLLYSAYSIFSLMLVGLIVAAKKRTYVAPYWFLAVIPGLFVLAAINAIGLGGYAYDDFSHWVPNALYVFVNNDIPSAAHPSLHSIFPGYPYALPFLTYLESLLVGGFLVQGGAMANFLLLFAFAAMLVEETGRKNESIVREKCLVAFGKVSFALLLAVFLNSSLATFGITNQGDVGTMVLCGALGIMLWRMAEALQLNDDTRVRNLYVLLALSSIAFVLIKESNIVLLLLLVFSFFVVAARNGTLRRIDAQMLLVFLPALALSVLWQLYARVEIVNGNVGILPFHAWRFDLFVPLLEGVWAEIQWKSAFFILFIGTLGCGISALFCSRGKWRDFAVLALIVQTGYLVFLVLAFLGSDFSEYTVRTAASFHRYMLHAVFLALPLFWFMAAELWPSFGKQIQSRLFPPSNFLRLGGTLVLVFAVPFLIATTDWVTARPGDQMCLVRKLARQTAAALPDQAKLGAIFPPNDGLTAFIVNLGLALEEAQTGRSMSMIWHSDSFHSYLPPTVSDVEKQLKGHPETNALIYSPDAKDMMKKLGFKNAYGSGFLLREDGEWISRLIYLPKRF